MAVRHPVLLLPADYPDLADPQQFNGNWVAEQARALASRYAMSVVHPRLQKTGRSVIEQYHQDGLTTCIVRYRHLRKTWLLPYALAVRKGMRTLDLRPQCIHAHGLYPPGLVALVLGGWLGIPVVVTEHWGPLAARVAHSATQAFILRWVLRRASRVIAVSQAFANEMISLEPRCRPVVVPNTVLPDFFRQPLPRRLGATDTRRVLFVGSLHDDRKGLAVLLPALALLKRRGAPFDVHLSIIGDGVERPGAERLARELGLGDACTFLGNRARDEVVAAMASCDLLAVPSRYETFGVVYAEAMACGKPVVACAQGPVAEVVPPWAGRLVPAGDSEGLAAALEFVARNPTAFDPHRIRAYAEQRFGLQAFLENMAQVYGPLLEPAAP